MGSEMCIRDRIIFNFFLVAKFFIYLCSLRQGSHQVAKKFTKITSLPNSFLEINISSFIIGFLVKMAYKMTRILSPVVYEGSY